MSTSLKRPPALKKGDTIGVIAPASPFDRSAFDRGVQRLENYGFRVKFRDDIFARRRYLAGEDTRRFAELEQYLLDPQVTALFVARGGYGSMRLLPLLEQMKQTPPPKILMGHSDITSLQIYAYQRWRWVTFHGPVVAKDIGDRLAEAGEASLLRTLMDPAPLGPISIPEMTTLHPGKTTAPLVGGCLSLIACSLGTPYQLKTEEKILYIEDVGELLYSLDRLLTHLRLAGLFRSVKGIVFGPLKDAHDEPEVIQSMLKDVLGDLDVPMVFGFPSGHVEDSWTIPMGLEVTLDADQRILNFSESALENHS